LLAGHHIGEARVAHLHVALYLVGDAEWVVNQFLVEGGHLGVDVDGGLTQASPGDGEVLLP